MDPIIRYKKNKDRFMLPLTPLLDSIMVSIKSNLLPEINISII
jgi:hypothetical protein